MFKKSAKRKNNNEGRCYTYPSRHSLQMNNDFFIFSRQTIEQATSEAHFDMAHNRAAAIRSLKQFCGKEELPFDQLTPGLMAQFKRWIIGQGRKESTARLYVNQVSAVYKAAVKAGIAPERHLLEGIHSAMPAKQERRILTEEDLRRMRHADLSEFKHMAYARDLFLFSIYGRGISFTDMAYIKKTDVQGRWLTYTSQVANPSTITVPWDTAMQEIVNRHPSTTDYLLPILKFPNGQSANGPSANGQAARRNIRQVRENMCNALKQIATRCNLTVVPTMYMVKDICQRAMDSVCLSRVI